MIKRIIAPVQAWILLQGKCVACGKNLSLGEKSKRSDNKDKVVCSCLRIYLFDKRTGRYERANFDEV